jgi:hypothetical protein
VEDDGWQTPDDSWQELEEAGGGGGAGIFREVGYLREKTNRVSCPPGPQSENWFCKSQPMSMVAIGLRKPYAKKKVGESCTCMMFIDSLDGC